MLNPELNKGTEFDGLDGEGFEKKVDTYVFLHRKQERGGETTTSLNYRALNSKYGTESLNSCV